MRDAAILESSLVLAGPAKRVTPQTPSSVPQESAGTLDLITLARNGDMAAFDELMRRHERMVLMTALRCRNGNMADAQDAAQTVFLRLHRSLGQFRDSERADAFPSWLYRITVNVCLDMNRKEKRRNEVAFDIVSHGKVGLPNEAVTDGDSQREALQAGLHTLGEKERAAIVLRDIEGLETSEVASILGSSEATVRSQISVGRRKLRTFVEGYMRRQL